FGGEDAYALLRGEYLNPAANLGSGGALAHQRMALFGFDRLSQMPTVVKRIQVTTESWTLLDGMVIRPAAGPDSVRRISPCLVAASHHGRPQLGVLFGLQVGTDNVLSGGLHWYDGAIEAGWLKRPELREQAAPRIPVFLIRDGEALSLILPANIGARLGVGLTIDGTSLEHLQPREVLERGVDFVRYACRAA
ncbi:MAG TPA: hypothetical protein VF096_12410, partial [Azonexus sp.]